MDSTPVRRPRAPPPAGADVLGRQDRLTALPIHSRGDVLDPLEAPSAVGPVLAGQLAGLRIQVDAERRATRGHLDPALVAVAELHLRDVDQEQPSGFVRVCTAIGCHSPPAGPRTTARSSSGCSSIVDPDRRPAPPPSFPPACSRRRRRRCGSAAPRCVGCRRRRRRGGAVRVGRPVRHERPAVLRPARTRPRARSRPTPGTGSGSRAADEQCHGASRVSPGGCQRLHVAGTAAPRGLAEAIGWDGLRAPPLRRFGGRIEEWLISSPGRTFRATACRRPRPRTRRCRRARSPAARPGGCRGAPSTLGKAASSSGTPPPRQRGSPSRRPRITRGRRAG